jgi:GNAT superfamily N-acetyltransferase
VDVISMLPTIDQRLLGELTETMFASDERGRLFGTDAPHLHLLRTPEGLICRCHAGLADEVADALHGLAKRARGRPSEWASEYADYGKALSSVAQLKALRAGVLYSFPALSESNYAAVNICEDNAKLLIGGVEEWRSDIASGLPMTAMVVNGRAVSICASVKASTVAHCAGVETLPAYRGKGFASQAVAAWAKTVRALGAAPFYGTTFDNYASQRVARRLDPSLIGAEFSIECERRNPSGDPKKPESAV